MGIKAECNGKKRLNNKEIDAQAIESGIKNPKLHWCRWKILKNCKENSFSQ